MLKINYLQDKSVEFLTSWKKISTDYEVSVVFLMIRNILSHHVNIYRSWGLTPILWKSDQVTPIVHQTHENKTCFSKTLDLQQIH